MLALSIYCLDRDISTSQVGAGRAVNKPIGTMLQTDIPIK